MTTDSGNTVASGRTGRGGVRFRLKPAPTGPVTNDHPSPRKSDRVTKATLPSPSSFTAPAP
jgi:hypothetical protein